MKFLNVTLLALGLTLPVQSAMAGTNAVYILDGSNSMWGQIDGVAKIATAKSVMSDLLKNSPPDLNVGLVAYGHRSEGKCDDIEVLKALGPKDADASVKLVNAIKPKGKTPIGGSLKVAAAMFSETDAYNNIILVSDGVETCDVDPCVISADLAAKGIHTKVHVVGFDIGEVERKELQCIASKGNGKYYGAKNADELKLAFAAVESELVTPVAEEPAPPPAKPKWEEVYRDDFDGSELSADWTVSNPNPDGYIIEDGQLLVIANVQALLSSGEAQNLMSLNIPLPEGDFEVEVTYSAEFNTGAEIVSIALLDDPQNFIAASGAVLNQYPDCSDRVMVSKNSGGTISQSIERASWLNGCGTDITRLMKDKAQPVSLKLIREGRSFRAAYRYADLVLEDKTPGYVLTSTVNTLRSPKTLYLLAGQNSKVPGETLFKIDSIVVRRLMSTGGD